MPVIRSMWVLPAVAAVAVMTAGCGGQPDQNAAPPPAEAQPQSSGPPASGPVSDVIAICGVQGVYWQGAWWAIELPIQTVKDEGPLRRVSGTMTTTGGNHARLDSPDLMAPQTLWKTPNTRMDAPPFQLCKPTSGD